MLKELNVKNFALIDELGIEFNQGFNVLTGETGAGKSILLDSIGILCGKRASWEMIRKGEEKASVQGCFELDNEMIDRIKALDIVEVEDKEFFLSREISVNGSNKCRINFKSVPLGIYQKVGSLLFDIHGQNQEQSLLYKEKQLELLDKFISLKPACSQLFENVRRSYRDYAELSKRLLELKATAKEKEDMLAYYEFAVKEIEEAKLDALEEELLKDERSRILNSEKLTKKGELVYSSMNNSGVMDNLGTAIHALKEMSLIDKSLDSLIEQFEGSYYELEGLNDSFRDYFSCLEYDEEKINSIETRLGDINRLKRKYGGSVEAVLSKLDEMKSKLEFTGNKEAAIANLMNEIKMKKDEYDRYASELTEKRMAGAKDIEKAIKDRLKALSIYPDGFIITFEKNAEPDFSGGETVEFLFSPNKGEGAKPLRKIASGGEVSRVMLAFKGIFAEIDYIPTLIFDEIDAGVGGEALLKVAEALEKIGRIRQVICVTHAAIIAAFADQIHSVKKVESKDRTKVKIDSLTIDEDTVDELSRMLGGKNNFKAVRDQAKEMISFAKKKKKV